MNARHGLGAGMLVAMAALGVWACGDDDDDGVGSSCSAAEQCFVGIADKLAGEPLCLTRVQGGYCTHECAADSDCCNVEGECPNGKEQVCAPFESTGQRMCFLSCEGQADGDAFCGQYAHSGFRCRSTGGGSANRKVCVP